MNKKSISITPGVMLMMMILIILVITSFAALFYIEAIREYNMVNKSYDMLEEYYKADSEALYYLEDVKKDINAYDDGAIIEKKIKINNNQDISVLIEIKDQKINILEYRRNITNEMEY